MIKWYKVFGEENVKIVLFEDFEQDPYKIINDLFNFLQVDTSFKPRIVHTQKNGKLRNKKMWNIILNTKEINKIFKLILPKIFLIRLRYVITKLFLKKSTISDKTLHYLIQFYEQDVKKLNEFGVKISNWK